MPADTECISAMVFRYMEDVCLRQDGRITLPGFYLQ